MYFKLKVYNGCEVQFPANQIRLLSKFFFRDLQAALPAKKPQPDAEICQSLNFLRFQRCSSPVCLSAQLCIAVFQL